MSDGVTDMHREKGAKLKNATPSAQAIECPKHGAQPVVHIDEAGLEVMCKACYDEQLKEIIQDPDQQERLKAHIEQGVELSVSMGTHPNPETGMEMQERIIQEHYGASPEGRKPHGAALADLEKRAGMSGEASALGELLSDLRVITADDKDAHDLLDSIDAIVPEEMMDFGEADLRLASAAMGVLGRIHEALYPGGDPDHEWSPDTIQEIAEIVDEFIPKPGYTIKQAVEYTLDNCEGACLDNQGDRDVVRTMLLDQLKKVAT